MKNGIKDLPFTLGKKTLFLKCKVQNGFRERVTRLTDPNIVMGFSLFVLAAIAVLSAWGVHPLSFLNDFISSDAVAMAIGIPIAIKIKKDGLTGDNLKLMEDFEKRIENINIDALTEAQVVELHTKALTAAFEPYLKLKGLDADAIGEMLKLKATIIAQGEEITKLKALGASPEAKGIRAQLEAWMEENKVEIAKIKSGEKAELKPFKIKAITMTEAASLGGSAYLPNVQVLPGYIDLVRKAPTFWDRLLKPGTKANPLVWVNKHNKLGNAQFIGEGILKPLASFELQTETSTPKKVAERMKVSTEMINDIDYLTGMITQELVYEVDMASNLDVLTGSGTGDHPKGVTLYGAAYSLATITGVIAPNNTDAMVAAIAQLRSTNFLGKLTAYINPIDNAQRKLSKTLTGEYVNNLQVTVDAEIVEDNNIAVGYLLIGDMSKYHIQMYQDFFVAWGWENDDFTKNLLTVIGERRFHQWVSSNETGAFIYDTFANIKTAIA